MLDRIRKLLTSRTRRLRPAHLRLGEQGERAALEFLKRDRGYKIVATNFRLPLGRNLRGQRLTAEVDIIAYDGDTLAFVEVKTRTSDEVAAPERAVDLRKQRQIARAARRYRRLMNVVDESYRYDVVTVKPREGGYKVELLRGYFDDSVFQIRRQ